MSSIEYSIIICTLNRCKILAEALAYHAKLDAEYRVSREYIIVDNGSTDTTKQVVSEFSSSVSADVRYLFVEERGHSIALNQGCKIAAGDYFVFTDDDTFPDQEWLPAIHAMFCDQDADWIYGPIMPIWRFGPVPKWYGVETMAFLACLDLGHEALVATKDSDASFYGANHACRRSSLYSLGLYNEELGLRGDGLSFRGNDTDLYSKARQAGMKIVYCPQASVDHLIAKGRYKRSKHRSVFAQTGRNEFKAMVDGDVEFGPLYRASRRRAALLLGHLYQWPLAILQANSPLAFWHETRVIRFWNFLKMSFFHSLGFRSRS